MFSLWSKEIMMTIKIILTLLWCNFTLSMGQGKYCASSASGQLPKWFVVTLKIRQWFLSVGAKARVLKKVVFTWCICSLHLYRNHSLDLWIACPRCSDRGAWRLDGTERVKLYTRKTGAGRGGGGMRGEWADLTRGIARDFKVVCTWRENL